MLKDLKSNSPWGLAALVMLVLTLVVLAITTLLVTASINEVGMLSAMVFTVSIIVIIVVIPIAIFSVLGIAFALTSIFLKKEKKAPALISLVTFSLLIVIFLFVLLTAR